MKKKSSKFNKFNKFNIFNKINFKTVSVLVLLLIPIYILYIESFLENMNKKNESQDISLKKSEEELNTTVEAFNNYVNLCESKPTHVYDLPFEPINIAGGYPNISEDTSKCNYYCDKSFAENGKKCDMYILNSNNQCIMYDLSNLPSTKKITVNCNKNILPVSSGLIYNGRGYVNENYFKSRDDKNKSKKSNFEHKDYLLDEANNLKQDFNRINSEIIRIQGTDDDRSTIQGYYSSLTSKIKQLADHLDLSRNKIFSTFVDDPTYSIASEQNVTINDKDISYSTLLHSFDKLYDKNMTLNSSLDHHYKEFNRNYMLYSALVIIMIITCILLVLYKFIPGLIPDSKMAVYFIGVLLIMFFMHNVLKI